MKAPFRKYIAFLLLLIFFFPMAEKELHALEHHDDIHCTATDKHFHELEHSCDICDLAISSSDPLPESNITFILSSAAHSYRKFSPAGHSPAAFQDLPSRAPPIA